MDPKWKPHARTLCLGHAVRSLLALIPQRWGGGGGGGGRENHRKKIGAGDECFVPISPRWERARVPLTLVSAGPLFADGRDCQL